MQESIIIPKNPVSLQGNPKGKGRLEGVEGNQRSTTEPEALNYGANENLREVTKNAAAPQQSSDSNMSLKVSVPYSSPCRSAHSAGASPLHPAQAPCRQVSPLAICGDLASKSLKFVGIARASSAESWQPLIARIRIAQREQRHP